MYTIEFTRRAKKEFAKIPSQFQKQIRNKLDAMANNPRAAQQVKALKGEEGAYRLRVGDYRIVYYMENDRLVIVVVTVAHRKEVYL